MDFSAAVNLKKNIEDADEIQLFLTCYWNCYYNFETQILAGLNFQKPPRQTIINVTNTVFWDLFGMFSNSKIQTFLFIS